MTIRHEAPLDVEPVHRLVASAFATDAEARLVDELRRAGDVEVSLVAEDEHRDIVGHVAFSTVATEAGSVGVGLAPLAVRADRRRRGIGARLVEEGLAACRERGFRFAVVLGDPEYYARFGFGAATAHGLHDEYGGGDAFQVLALVDGGLPAGEGLVVYSPAFATELAETA